MGPDPEAWQPNIVASSGNQPIQFWPANSSQFPNPVGGNVMARQAVVCDRQHWKPSVCESQTSDPAQLWTDYTDDSPDRLLDNVWTADVSICSYLHSLVVDVLLLLKQYCCVNWQLLNIETQTAA